MASSPVEAINDASISDATRATYGGTLSLLSELLEFNPYSRSDFISRMSDASNTYDIIKGRWPDPSTRCRVLTCILAIVRHGGMMLRGKGLTIWKHIHWVLTRNTARRHGKLSAKEEAAWVPFSEIAITRERLARTEFGSFDHLFLAWYTLWPPLRADFYDTVIYRTERDVPPELRRWMYFKPPFGNGTMSGGEISAVLRGGAKGGAVHKMSTRKRNPEMPLTNFIVLQPETPREWTSSMPKPTWVNEWDRAPRLVLLKHKTANTHGRVLRSLPIRLAEVLDASLYDTPREVLFLRPDGQRFNSPHAYTVWGERLLARLFEGRRLGFNGLRHSYISNVSFDESSPQQLATLARDMAHSEFQQRRYTRGTFKEGRAPVMKEPDTYDARRFHRDADALLGKLKADTARRHVPRTPAKGLNLMGRKN